MSTQNCMVPECRRSAAANRRGLCLVCYSRAKAKVASGETTWNEMVSLCLCEEDSEPFDKAFAERKGKDAQDETAG